MEKVERHSGMEEGKNGAPGEIRTPDLLIRSKCSYPIDSK